MNKQVLNLFIVLALVCASTSHYLAQTTFGDSLSIKPEAVVQNAPHQITISWPADNDASNFVIYKKLKSAGTWGNALDTLVSSATQFLDTAVSTNVLYDYKIKMNTTTALVKYGYISTGIDVKANSNRGIAILVIENSYISHAGFQAAINQLITDVELDGWYPKTIYVNKTDSVPVVKNQIVSKYNEDPTHTKLLLLFGNVPVPYSGDLNPDGHPDHQGAWPTDTYYADMDGQWDDVSVNDLASSNPLNHNIPNDGKFDPSYIPSTIDLQVGRVDLSNLPSSAYSEENLLLNYLTKLHKFKSSQITVASKGLIDDNFGLPEGFSQNGYNNFSTLVGRNNIVIDDYFTQLSYNTSTTGTYLWSFGCGGGSYTSAGGIGTSQNFEADSLSAVFTMLFGSYFGDWNYSDAFLRAAISQGNTLTSVWAGRPNWYFQHMAMGENIGYCAQLTQNNASTYVTNSVYTNGMGQLVSINLLGEPTLRNAYPVQPSALQINGNGDINTLSWTAGSSEDGYNIYRRYDDSTHFYKLNNTLITSTSFVDSTVVNSGIIHYYVKAVKTTTSPSGIYDNESLGIKGTVIMNSVGIKTYLTQQPVTVYPNPFVDGIIVSGDNIKNIKVFDFNGQLVKSIETDASTTELALSDLSAGVYMLAIHNVSGTVTHKKIVKLK